MQYFPAYNCSVTQNLLELLDCVVTPQEAKIIKRRIIGWLVKNELEKLYKEAVVS
jgi:hypothetical protein